MHEDRPRCARGAEPHPGTARWPSPPGLAQHHVPIFVTAPLGPIGLPATLMLGTSFNRGVTACRSRQHWSLAARWHARVPSAAPAFTALLAHVCSLPSPALEHSPRDWHLLSLGAARGPFAATPLACCALIGIARAAIPPLPPQGIRRVGALASESVWSTTGAPLAPCSPRAHRQRYRHVAFGVGEFSDRAFLS